MQVIRKANVSNVYTRTGDTCMDIASFNVHARSILWYLCVCNNSPPVYTGKVIYSAEVLLVTPLLNKMYYPCMHKLA